MLPIAGQIPGPIWLKFMWTRMGVTTIWNSKKNQFFLH